MKILLKLNTLKNFKKVCFLTVSFVLGSYSSCLPSAADTKEKKTNPHKEEQKKDSNEKKWLPTINLGGKYGNQRRLGQVSLFSPIYQNETELYFLDLRFMGDSRTAREGNFGIGKRWITQDNKYILGVYGFYDRRRTEFSNFVNQLTLGLEAMSETWDYRLNVYYPQNSSKEIEIGKATIPKGEKHDYRGHNEYIYQKTATQTTKVKEIPLKGLDLELGNAFPGVKALRIYGAYYHFHGQGKAKSIDGVRLRGNYQFNEYISFIAEGSYDGVRKRSGFVGLQLRIPLGERSNKAKKLTALQKRMTDSPERDIDIVTSAPEFVEESSPTTAAQPSMVITDNYFVEVVEDDDNSIGPNVGMQGDGTHENPFKVKKSAYVDFSKKEQREINTNAAKWIILPPTHAPEDKQKIEQKLEQGLVEKIPTNNLEAKLEKIIEETTKPEELQAIKERIAEQAQHEAELERARQEEQARGEEEEQPLQQPRMLGQPQAQREEERRREEERARLEREAKERRREEERARLEREAEERRREEERARLEREAEERREEERARLEREAEERREEERARLEREAEERREEERVRLEREAEERRREEERVRLEREAEERRREEERVRLEREAEERRREEELVRLEREAEEHRREEERHREEELLRRVDEAMPGFGKKKKQTTKKLLHELNDIRKALLDLQGKADLTRAEGKQKGSLAARVIEIHNELNKKLEG